MKISELPPKYKKLAIRNAKNSLGPDYDEEEDDNLSYSFAWAETPEKGEFWFKAFMATNKSELPPIPRKKRK